MKAMKQSDRTLVSMNDWKHQPAPSQDAWQHNEGAKRPDTDYVVLGYIAAHPEGIHGYRLAKILAQAPVDGVSMPLGKLYRHLHRWAQAGLIEGHVDSVSNRLRTRFTLTDKGRAAFQRWLANPWSDDGFNPASLLRRLRFARAIPRRVVLSWLDEAERRCADATKRLASAAREAQTRGDGDDGLFIDILKARTKAHQRFITDVRQILSRIAQPAESAAG